MITTIFLFVWGFSYSLLQKHFPPNQSVFMILHIQYLLIDILVYIQVVVQRYILGSISFTTRFLLEVFFWIFMQHCFVSVNTERKGWVGVKLFVYFSFILYTDSFNDGNMCWFWIYCVCKIWFSKCAQNCYTTVNLLYMKFSASIKKGLHQVSDQCFFFAYFNSHFNNILYTYIYVT